MNFDWAKILEQLKSITGFRFYFLGSLIFLIILTLIFKDDISGRVKQMDLKRVEFREVRDMKGLEISLMKLKDTVLIKDYTVYIYQPRIKPYYKKLLVTSSDLIKSIMRLQGSYLEDQVTINEAFKTYNYVLLSKDEIQRDTEYLHELGMDYILVYKLAINGEPIGEIQMILSRVPTAEERKAIIKKLAPLVHIYVL